MGTIHVSAEGLVNAPAPTVYGYLADMHEHHPHFLPEAFSDFEVEEGGGGGGAKIGTTWEGAGGIGGFFERTFAPRMMKRIYAQELASLNEYAVKQAATSS